MRLDLPATLGVPRRELLERLADDLDALYGDALLGLALAGSAGRATDDAASDLDLLVLLDESADSRRLDALRGPDLDLIPLTLGFLEQLAEFGDDKWGYRWTYAWIPTLLDRTGGRIPAALARHERLAWDEVDAMLLGHGRLDEWINQIYRALKSARRGRTLEAVLDGSESVPAFLDIVFALEGRVRPYNSSLAWSLEHHPLDDWDAPELLDRIGRMREGDAATLVEAFRRIRELAARVPDARLSAALVANLDDWPPDEHYGVLYGR